MKESKKEQVESEYLVKQIYELLKKLKGDEYFEYLALQTLSAEICKTHGFAKWKNYISEQLEKNKGGN